MSRLQFAIQFEMAYTAVAAVLSHVIPTASRDWQGLTCSRSPAIQRAYLRIVAAPADRGFGESHGMAASFAAAPGGASRAGRGASGGLGIRDLGVIRRYRHPRRSGKQPTPR